MLPNFLVIGAEKSGTTWLHKVLRSHPDIFMPATKELHFFNLRDSNLSVLDAFERRGLGWYEQFFADHQDEARIGEVTPMYLCDEQACARIHATLPDAKLVAILRHPVDRAYAHYWMAFSKGHESRSFDEVVASRDERIIERGLYGRQLERFLGTFPKEQIKVIVFEDIVHRPMDALAELAVWLGLVPEPLAGLELDAAANPSSTYASPAVYRLGPKIARMMQSNPLTFRVHKSLKSMGLVDWVKGRNRRQWKYEALNDAAWLNLAMYYDRDIMLLETQLGHRIDPWRNAEELRHANYAADRASDEDGSI